MQRLGLKGEDGDWGTAGRPGIEGKFGHQGVIGMKGVKGPKGEPVSVWSRSFCRSQCFKNQDDPMLGCCTSFIAPFNILFIVRGH